MRHLHVAASTVMMMMTWLVLRLMMLTVLMTVQIILIMISIYMGGLALMVISSKIWEFSPFFMSTSGII